jgi:hypothetical protein
MGWYGSGSRGLFGVKCLTVCMFYVDMIPTRANLEY